MDWNEEKVEQLKALLGTGLSAAEIGVRMEITRNAVIGKVHRLGLFFVEHPKKPKPKKKYAKKMLRLVVSRPLPKIVPIYQGKSIGMMELTEFSCRAPMEKGMYCGASQQDNSSYCPKHHAMFRMPNVRR